MRPVETMYMEAGHARVTAIVGMVYVLMDPACATVDTCVVIARHLQVTLWQEVVSRTRHKS